MMSLNKVCILILIVSLSHGRVPSIRLCGDKKCETIISLARTVINYHPVELNHVAFRGNTPCRVMSKSIGDNSDIWEIEVQGRRGYAPKNMIREQKIIIKAADLVQVVSVDEPDLAIEEAENATATVESTLYAEPENVPKADEPVADDPVTNEKVEQVATEQVGQANDHFYQVANDKVEPTLNAKVPLEDNKYEEDLEEEILIDEDDEDEYANQQPVDEPLAIKRDMYKTGDIGEQNTSNDKADVHLEVVGLDTNEAKVQTVEEKIHGGKENEIESTKKLENQNEQHVDVTEKNGAPEVTSQELEYQNSVNSQPPNDNVIPPKTEEPQNSDEQYVNESVTPSNGMENIAAINQVESTEPVLSDPISQLNHELGNVNTKESQSFEENKVLDIISGATPSGESESAYGTPPYTNTDTQEPSGIENVYSERLDNSTQEVNEDNPEYFANSSNEIPTPNKIPNQMQQDTVGKYVENTEKYDAPKTSDINIPEPIVTPDPIQQAADVQNEDSTEAYIPTTQNIVEQKPEIIENEVHNSHEQIYDSESKLPPPSPPQTVENEVRTDDIFSPNFKPESPPTTTTTTIEDDGTNWYDGILIFVEDTFASVKKIFDNNASKEVSKGEWDNVENSLDQNGYCESIQGENCPKSQQKFIPAYYMEHLSKIGDMSNSKLVNDFLTQVVARADLVVLLLLTASAILIFIFGHYFFVNHRREGALIAQINILEKKLHASQKESSLTKEHLLNTAKKLDSIADQSFGTDDMIKQYETEKKELLEQIAALEKELETAAEAGLELNKMVQDLLSNQSGSDSIINSVEELQHQLNEQEANMIYINNLLAEKSRENSELQVLLSDTNHKFGAEIQQLLDLNKQLETAKETLEQQLNEKVHSLEAELKENIEVKSNEIANLREKNNALKKKYDEIVSKWRSSAARADALEDTIKKMETFNGKDDIKTIIEATDVNAQCIALERENESLNDQLDSETESKNRLQEQIKELNDEITRLRAEFNQHEKDKLEAETRLEVLSSYFKEKESQLQKELNVKEALFMKQQGESTTTVDRIRTLQEDIQKLRSQNDELRAEIEAQAAAHKAQINAAEVRAHDSWLAAKQAERRLEEARSEASILRKKLTSLTAFNGTTSENNFNRNPIDGFIPEINAPSPIHLESPSSPGLPPLNLPPPPLIPPSMYSGLTNVPFMPPPPLPLPNEMRPAPLGRLMSPPPPDHRFVGNFVEPSRYESNRYSPDDYPGDLYETETDFSPPRSPPRSPDFYRGRNYRNYSPEVPVKKKSNRKGTLSSGSVESRDRI